MIEVFPIEIPWDQSRIIVMSAIPIGLLLAASVFVIIFVFSIKRGFRLELLAMSGVLLITGLWSGSFTWGDDYTDFKVTQPEFKEAVEQKYAISINSFAQENEPGASLNRNANSKIFYATDDNGLEMTCNIRTIESSLEKDRPGKYDFDCNSHPPLRIKER